MRLILNGIEHYLLEGDSTCIVLIHDGIGCCELWKDFPNIIHEATGHTVFVYSRYNHGKSDESTVPFSFSNEVEVLNKLLTYYNIIEPILFGHSIGSVIAIYYAAKFKVKKIVVTAVYLMYDQLIINGMKSIRARYEAGTMVELVKAHSNPNAMFYIWCDIGLSANVNDMTIFNKAKEVLCEVICIKYDKDPYFGNNQLELLQEAIPNVNIIILKGTAHTIHKRNPGMLKQYLS